MSKHISAQRVSDSKTKALWDRLKLSVRTVYGLLRADEGDVAYLKLFKSCYLHLWDDIEVFHKDQVRWGKSRQRKGLKQVYQFKAAEDFLLYKLKVYRHLAKFKKQTYESEEQRAQIISQLQATAEDKSQRKHAKAAERERFHQHTTPRYVMSYEQAYFNVRRYHPEDIDTRYLILHEMAKYKCDASISFLTKIVRCDKNLPLQHFAWKCLNNMGVTGAHKGRRKGKKKFLHLKSYKPLKTPEELLAAIRTLQIEQMKTFDIFLSHSYKDSQKLIELKDALNALGLNVFVDWVNDRDELSRELACSATADVLLERLNACRAVIYVHTNSAINSRWTPWELGYAHAKRKPICVYRIEETQDEPEYLQLYPSVVREDDKFFVKMDEKKTPLQEWIKIKDYGRE